MKPSEGMYTDYWEVTHLHHDDDRKTSKTAAKRGLLVYAKALFIVTNGDERVPERDAGL